jgi:hypothetical protein
VADRPPPGTTRLALPPKPFYHSRDQVQVAGKCRSIHRLGVHQHGPKIPGLMFLTAMRK